MGEENTPDSIRKERGGRQRNQYDWVLADLKTPEGSKEQERMTKHNSGSWSAQ
jgi:hypothetical protein